MKNKRCEGIDCAWCLNVECPNERKTKMTDEEFIKNEQAIMSQLREGLIK